MHTHIHTLIHTLMQLSIAKPPSSMEWGDGSKTEILEETHAGTV